jgi:plastocyanin
MTRRSTVQRAAAAIVAAGALTLTTQHQTQSLPAQASSVHGSSAATTAGRRSDAAATVLLHRRVVKAIIVDFTFKPAHLVVSPGTRVVWTNDDSDPHTVTSDAGAFTSDALDTGSRYAHTFKTAGTFHYHCKIHPFMHGTVVVKG